MAGEDVCVRQVCARDLASGGLQYDRYIWTFESRKDPTCHGDLYELRIRISNILALELVTFPDRFSAGSWLDGDPFCVHKLCWPTHLVWNMGRLSFGVHGLRRYLIFLESPAFSLCHIIMWMWLFHATALNANQSKPLCHSQPAASAGRKWNGFRPCDVKTRQPAIIPKNEVSVGGWTCRTERKARENQRLFVRDSRHSAVYSAISRSSGPLITRRRGQVTNACAGGGTHATDVHFVQRGASQFSAAQIFVGVERSDSKEAGSTIVNLGLLDLAVESGYHRIQDAVERTAQAVTNIYRRWRHDLGNPWALRGTRNRR